MARRHGFRLGLRHANAAQRVETVNTGDVAFTRERDMRSHATFLQQRSEFRMVGSLQGAFTMGGNISLFYAAKVLANEEPRLDVLLSTKEEEDDDKENGETTETRKEKAQIEIWDVERLGLLFEKDDEFAFSFKIALVSVGIAAFVRGASLVFSPEFDYNSLSSSSSSNHHDELNAYALLFVFIPLLINYVKCQLRFRAEEEESARMRIGGGRR